MICLETVRMTSPLTIQIDEAGENQAVQTRAQDAFKSALLEVDRLTDLLSEYQENSEIGRINQNAGRQELTISEDTANVLALALSVAQSSDGAFDPTFRPLLNLWDYNRTHTKLPSDESIQSALELVGYKKIEFDFQSRKIRLPKKGMWLGLGAVSKGYIVQAIVDVFRRYNFNNFLVNAGGDIFASGSKGGKSWKIGVPDPSHRNRMSFYVPVSNAAFCTSASYERFIELNGKRYGHILNPKTGYPVQYTQGVTVIANKMAYCDAIATTIFVLGPAEGLAFADHLPQTEAIIFDENSQLLYSEGLNNWHE
ncbi:MAG: FAD:protein FMN transferase [SAR324 cluster bacterium]|nr:FAD:protein FMN transferase [SAR324 cluster bacterium]